MCSDTKTIFFPAPPCLPGPSTLQRRGGLGGASSVSSSLVPMPSAGSLVKLVNPQGEKAGPEEKSGGLSAPHSPSPEAECLPGHRLSVLKLGQARANWDKSVTLGKEGKRNHIPAKGLLPLKCKRCGESP